MIYLKKEQHKIIKVHVKNFIEYYIIKTKIKVNNIYIDIFYAN